jgi:hypothetical protein
MATMRKKFHFLNEGTGEQKIPNWYYDADKAECSAFIYTGSEGNANRNRFHEFLSPVIYGQK